MIKGDIALFFCNLTPSNSLNILKADALEFQKYLKLICFEILSNNMISDVELVLQILI